MSTDGMVFKLEEPGPAHSFRHHLRRIRAFAVIQNGIVQRDERHVQYKSEILNQAYVLYLFAGWQAFFQELVEFGFEHWDVANSHGIENPVIRNLIDDRIGKFSTPSVKNIDTLFYEIFAIKKLSNRWGDAECGRDRACQILDELIKARNQIAHTARCDIVLSKEENFERARVLLNVAQVSQSALLKHIRGEDA